MNKNIYIDLKYNKDMSKKLKSKFDEDSIPYCSDKEMANLKELFPEIFDGSEEKYNPKDYIKL